MRKFTHREIRTRLAHLEEEYNSPSREDFYLMQIAGCVNHVLSSKPWSPNDYRIRFKGQDTEKDIAQRREQAKQLWKQRLAKSNRRQMYGR